MRIKTLFGTLLHTTYAASGSAEPLERFYSAMFASYFDRWDSQPSCAAVHAVLRGERLPPRRLLRHYRDERNPRCPERLREDLDALAYSLFAGVSQRVKLQRALSGYLEEIPREDAEDLRQARNSDDLVALWTYLTWYALCGDHCG